jgi:hypothetical protein
VNRFLTEVLVFAAVMAAMVLAVFAAGGGLAQPSARPTPVALPAEPGCLEAPIVQVAGSGIRGAARLCVVDEAVRPRIEVKELLIGTVYTAWFLYFDRPTACKTNPCTDADLLGFDPPGVLGRMDGIVADGSRGGYFWGDYRDLGLSAGSQVTLLMLGHGAARTDNHLRARQFLTPQMPKLGSPAAGTVADGEAGSPVAYAIFALP